MWRFLLIVPLTFMLLSCDDSDSLFTPPDDVATDIFDHVNYYRLTNGTSALISHNTLIELAVEHAEYMAQNNEISHDNQAERYKVVVTELCMSKFAELIARGDLNGRDLTDLWNDDPDSKATLLGDYMYIGVGVHDAGNEVFATVIFSK